MGIRELAEHKISPNAPHVWRRMPGSLPACGTFSRDPRLWGGDNFQIKTIGKGEGARIMSGGVRLEGSYLDWVCSLGANLLGHNYRPFMRVLETQMRRGLAFSIAAHGELELARRLAYFLGMTVPGWTGPQIGVRFGLSGSDACEMAVRLARAVTGKKTVISIGYHGWSSTFVAATPPALGILPEEGKHIIAAPFNDREWFQRRDWRKNDVACVIVEQPIEDPAPRYYDFLRLFCDEHQALLIIDEVVTGFRYAIGGVCEKYTIFPDLVCYGKGLGNGIPISALVGPRTYMDWFGRETPVFCSGTHMGNALSMAAGLAVLDIIIRNPVIEHLWQIGEALKGGLCSIGYDCRGHAPRTVLIWQDDAQKAYFIQGMLKRGILMNRPNFSCYAHTLEDVAMTLAAAREVKGEMDALDKGQMAEAVKDYMPRVLFRNR